MFEKVRQYRHLKKSNALDLIPVHEVKSGFENGVCCLYIQRFSFKFLNMLFKKDEFFKVKLDSVGSLIWQQIDGTKTVQDIVTSLEGKTVNQENLPERVVAFITSLYRKDLVKFVIKK